MAGDRSQRPDRRRCLCFRPSQVCTTAVTAATPFPESPSPFDWIYPMGSDVRAAVLILRRGPFAMQGVEAAQGLELWGRLDGVDLEFVDDPGAALGDRDLPPMAPGGPDPYRARTLRSGLVRRILPAVGRAGKVLWNHGGSADDLIRPGVVQVVARASTYLVGAVRHCARLGIGRLLIVTGKGPFAAMVAKGARDEARRLGISPELVIGVDRLTDVDPEAGSWLRPDSRRTCRSSSGSGAARPNPHCSDAWPPGFPSSASGSDRTRTVSSVPPNGFRGRIGPTSGLQGSASGTCTRRPTAGSPVTWRLRQPQPDSWPPQAHRRGMGRDDVLAWRTSTLLGDFALDGDWRQVGYPSRPSDGAKVGWS